MGLLYTMTAFTASGVISRFLSLGLQNKAMSHAPAISALWISTWVALGWSYADWKERQHGEYVRRLQHLVERKDRRDKWDRIYFQEQVDGEASA